MPIQYEVCLSLSAKLVPEYLIWLKAHIQEMLSFDGFENAVLLDHLDPEIESETIQLIVQYRLRDTKTFETYLNTHANRMRNDGLKHFGNKVKASRRLAAVSLEFYSPTDQQ